MDVHVVIFGSIHGQQHTQTGKPLVFEHRVSVHFPQRQHSPKYKAELCLLGIYRELSYLVSRSGFIIAQSDLWHFLNLVINFHFLPLTIMI